MNQAHSGHAYPPKQHYEWYKFTGTKSLEEDIGERLRKGVGDEEERESSIVLTPSDVQTFLKSIEFSISDIGSIEETDQIEQTEPGNESEVELEEESLVLARRELSVW